MRIVAGKYRRRKLEPNPGKTTRPITDLAKEILFERLQNDITGKRVADIFAGTGTIGMEALSRGAAGVVFIENDHRAFELLEKNVHGIVKDDPFLCWRTDALKSSFRPRGVPELVPFDTIFFDPPYRMIADIQPGQPIFRALQRLARDDVSSPNALLVIRTPNESQFECPAPWKRERVISLRSMEAHLFEKNSDTSQPDDKETP
ncbi:MAG: 16S rRNA (guanine(966)-N(2))-methyltransferase RsmD [Planctomycetaceae bacterium]